MREKMSPESNRNLVAMKAKEKRNNNNNKNNNDDDKNILITLFALLLIEYKNKEKPKNIMIHVPFYCRKVNQPKR